MFNCRCSTVPEKMEGIFYMSESNNENNNASDEKNIQCIIEGGNNGQENTFAYYYR